MSRARDFADLAGSADAGGLTGRNIVINGSASVNQRGDSTGVTSTGYYGPDRFNLLYTDAGTWSISQSSTAPEGFANSYKLDCTTAKASLASNSRLFVQTKIEGQNVQHLKKGTSNASKTTLSFWVRSNKTGTYQVNLEDNDNIRIIGATYAISAADTWEHKEITFAGDTSGAFTDDNGDSLAIMWALVAGTDNSSGAVPTAWEAKVNTDRGAGLTVNLADSTSNEWYITGVQLEVGQATPFEHRSFHDELARCQRYFYREVDDDGAMFSWVGFADSSTAAYLQHPHPVEMRAEPSMSTTGTAGDYSLRIGANTVGCNNVPALSSSTKRVGHVQWRVSSGLTTGQAVVGKHDAADKYIDWSAEL